MNITAYTYEININCSKINKIKEICVFTNRKNQTTNALLEIPVIGKLKNHLLTLL